jgi:hypothetical protein
MSANDVYLSPGVEWGGHDGVVPLHYFSEVVNRETGRSLRI